MTESLVAWHRLHQSLIQFGCPPGQLDSSQRARVEEGARRSLELEARVLATPWAGQGQVSDRQVAEAVQQVRSRYPDQQSFLADLTREGLTPKDLSRALERQLQVEQILKAVADEGQGVDEATARTFFEANRQRFHRPERRTARQILITVNPAYPENTPQAARRRMDRLALQLQVNPAAFPEQAARHSECPTALQEGLLGEVTRGKLYPALEEALFALEAGQISPVVETELGLHLLYCQAIHPARDLAFAQVRDNIMAALHQRQRQARQRDWLAAL